MSLHIRNIDSLYFRKCLIIVSFSITSNVRPNRVYCYIIEFDLIQKDQLDWYKRKTSRVIGTDHFFCDVNQCEMQSRVRFIFIFQIWLMS